MILREQRDDIFLISQGERGRIAEVLAGCVGNNRFEALQPSVILAASRIDRGMDDGPLPPRDVSLLDRESQLRLWEQSSRDAAAIDRYAGLLLALLGFWKSLNVGVSLQPLWQDDPTRARFDLNRFQHTMIELLEGLREQCGLRIDRPLKYGLIENACEPRERRLRSDLEWLNFLAGLSESICRGLLPAAALSARPRGAGKAAAFTIEISESRLLIDPWPFDRARIPLTVAARSVAHGHVPSDVVALPHKTFAIELGSLTI